MTTVLRTLFICMNKKVLLRECKRHTDCRVASTRYAVPVRGGWYPPGKVGAPLSRPGRYPPSSRPGRYPPPIQTWEGRYPPPIQTWEGVGTPPCELTHKVKTLPPLVLRTRSVITQFVLRFLIKSDGKQN